MENQNDTEQLNELSTAHLKKYMKKATANVKKNMKPSTSTDKGIEKIPNRVTGILRAKQQLNNRLNEQSNDTEQLNELSTAIVKRYVKKATANVKKNMKPSTSTDKGIEKIPNRVTGILRAKQQLNNRLNEQLEDIGTLVGLVASQEYADASSLVNDLLSARVAATLDEYKQHVAHNIFAPSLTEENEVD